jgi:hypothetical protein
MKTPDTNRQGRPEGSRTSYTRTSPDGVIKLPTGATLAVLLGVRPRTCQRWLAGTTQIPVAALHKWAQLEGWPPATFVAVAAEFARRRTVWEADQGVIG